MEHFHFIAAVCTAKCKQVIAQEFERVVKVYYRILSISAIAFSQMFHSNGDGCILKHVGKCHFIRMQMANATTHPFWTKRNERKSHNFCSPNEHSLGIYQKAKWLHQFCVWFFSEQDRKYNWCRNIHIVFDTMNASSSNNLLQFNVVCA